MKCSFRISRYIHQCLDILNGYHGYHAGARLHLNNLWVSWESSTGTAATEQTARARTIVETASTTISTGHGRVGMVFDKLFAEGLGALLQRQVEGGISTCSQSNGRGNAQRHSRLHVDLNLSRIFSQADASLFGVEMLKDVNDYSTPLANVFSRVKARKRLLDTITHGC